MQDRDAGAYRNQCRAEGKHRPAWGRTVDTGAHVSSDWFRANIWYEAIERSGTGVHVGVRLLAAAVVRGEPGLTLGGTDDVPWSGVGLSRFDEAPDMG